MKPNSQTISLWNSSRKPKVKAPILVERERWLKYIPLPTQKLAKVYTTKEILKMIKCVSKMVDDMSYRYERTEDLNHEDLDTLHAITTLTTTLLTYTKSSLRQSGKTRPDKNTTSK